MTLTGAQLSRIHKAILDAYDRDELRQMILTCMNENFSRHVSPEKRFSAQVFEFVEWANRQGRVLELLRCAAEGNERNAGLQALWVEAHTWDATPVQPAKAIEPSISPAASHHVFLAYSRKDDAIMRQLRSDLLAAGIVAWIDQEDLGLGTPVWQRAIEAAIRAARCVVVILTPDAKESDWVNTELSFARRIQRRIFPVLARGDEDNAVPFLLETTHRIDIRTDYAGGVHSTLIAALRKHLGNLSVMPPIDIEWITIPEGDFWRGSDKEKDIRAFIDETPLNRLYLPTFQIAKYPVTNAQYQVFSRATRQPPPEHWRENRIPSGKEDHPVVFVSWYDARKFCTWLSGMIGKVVRLPLDTEWEKAARGTDGRIWPWGNDPPTIEHCNFSLNVGDTTSVYRYAKGASPYEVMDMAGNVAEWTASLIHQHLHIHEQGRADQYGRTYRMLRGGRWLDDDIGIRCACRGGEFPENGYGDVGFRVVCVHSDKSDAL